MEKRQYLVSDTEMEIMEVLWELGRPTGTTELLQIFNGKGKDWKRQTLNTFLTRLKNKGLLKIEKRTIYVLYDKNEYQQLQTQKILKDMYGGEIRNFIVAFAGKNSGNEDDEKELLQLIDSLSKKERKKKK